MRSPIPSLVVLGSLLSTVFGTLYEDVKDLPTLEYDYVVVGGGTAGLVIANRLTELPNVRVLVLEAGVTNVNVTESIVPLLCPTLAPSTAWDWNYTTTEQVGFNGRAIPYTRGKLLGGSSSINYMLYTVGSRDDWNLYSTLTNSARWTWTAIQPLIQKIEKYVAPNDHHDTTGQYDPAIHSTTGKVSVSLAGYPVPLDPRVMSTLQELPDDFPFQLDMNGGNPIGIGWVPAAIGDGQRSSSATAYLSPIVSRKNLAVLLHAQATKIIQTGIKDGAPLFSKVEFARDASTAKSIVTAKKEIILSAGVFNTPQLLMLSGIGDHDELSKLGIKPILNLTSVGKNLQDHPFVPNSWSVNSNDTFQDHLTADVFPSEMARWSATHAGPLSFTLMNQVAWLRLPDTDPIFKTYKDPSNGLTSAHHEFMITNGYAAAGVIPPGDYMTVSSVLVSPMSRGTVSLKSTNPFDHPLIDPRFLEHPFDIHTMVESMKAAKKFVSASAWKDYVIAPYGPPASVVTDADLATYARENAASVMHALGTAAMSPKNANYGVVDPDLRVKGAAGLRIVDASVLPKAPSAHTQAPVYIIAERASELIKADMH